MTTIPFDSLRYFEQLQNAGMPPEQARVQAEAMRACVDAQAAIIKEQMATKQDVQESELRLQANIEKLKFELLKWQIGGGLFLAGIMAKGFGWLGF